MECDYVYNCNVESDQIMALLRRVSLSEISITFLGKLGMCLP